MRLLFILFMGIPLMAFAQVTPSIEEKPIILVSIQPYQSMIETLLPSSVADVKVLAPPYADVHTFEPKPSQMVALDRIVVWFALGDPFEEKFRSATSYKKDWNIIDLKQKLPLIEHEHGKHSCPHHHSHDPHIWFSARMMKLQVRTIATELIQQFPQHKKIIKKNEGELLEKLEKLDLQIQRKLSHLTSKTLLTVHPAYAYFCRDYNVRQISLECEGKVVPTKQQTEVVKEIQESKLRHLVVQQQFLTHNVEVFAQKMELKLVRVDPFSKDFFRSLLQVAQVVVEDSCNVCD